MQHSDGYSKGLGVPVRDYWLFPHQVDLRGRAAIFAHASAQDLFAEVAR